MDWVASIHQAIQYIEEHLREELTIREIAQQAALSPFYFQKGFAQPHQGLNQQLFSPGLPTNPAYKLAAGINVELYSDASRFEDGTQDQDFYCEVLVPVEKK